MISHIFGIDGTNPHQTEFAEKLTAIESFQTMRTGKEFSELIHRILRSVSIIPQRKGFKQVSYDVVFSEQPEKQFGVYFPNPIGTTIRHIYTEQGERKIIQVYSLPARTIPGLWQDIVLERVKSNESIPIYIGINNHVHELSHSPRILPITKFKF